MSAEHPPQLRLYDTMRREICPVVSATPGALTVYACGPTVYRDAHVGNMRTFLLLDLLRRAATLSGLRVRTVQNITDVGHMADDTGLGGDGLGGVDEGQGDTEDRVLAEARTEGRGALDITRHYEQRFRDDLALLNITPADEMPRASELIELMVSAVSRLIEKKNAYVGADGTVYFDARSFDSYGALSGNKLDELRSGTRFEGPEDPVKRFHADWALWKRAPETRTQLVWDTPWGVGFPGWHIECTAMSLDRLGSAIDVHIGGIDLRFPHHEDERAQSNSIAGREVVGHWLHGEHLLFEGRKMSKSSGNVVLVSDVIARGLDPLALRLVFLEHRYRQQLNLTWSEIEAADATLRRWRQRVASWAESPSGAMEMSYVNEVLGAYCDDLDTSSAVLALRRLERDDIPDGVKFETVAHVDRLFGLDLAREVGKTQTLPAGAQELLDRRAAARTAKEWALSDSLRDELAALGVTVADTAEGQTASF